MHRIATALLIASCLLSSHPAQGQAQAQTPPKARTGLTRPDADAIVTRLQASGVKLERPRATVFFEPGLISAEDEAQWVDRIDKGIEDLERFLHLTVPFKPDYYVAKEVIDTSSSFMGLGGAPPQVFLASDRVQQGAAPYLHETTHLIVLRYAVLRSPEQWHMWLFEGFPSYVEDAVVEKLGGMAGHVFAQGGNAAIDRAAAEALAMPRGHEVLEFIGRQGAPQDLADRANVARPFYVLSQSFTKYLVDTIGLDAFMKSILPKMLYASAFEAEVLRLSGKTLGTLRMEWLTKISGPPPAR